MPQTPGQDARRKRSEPPLGSGTPLGKGVRHRKTLTEKYVAWCDVGTSQEKPPACRDKPDN